MRKGLIILLLLPVACFSQKKDTKKLNLHTITSIGVAGGEKETAPVAQVSAGISYGPWFSGLGVGFDGYRYNSVPVFADWRFNFGSKRMFFLYLNAGYHFAANKGQLIANPFIAKDRLKGGLFGDGGMGFQVPAGRFNRIGLSIGYRYKRVVRTISYRSGCMTCSEDVYKDYYGFNTIVSKLSWEFGQ